MRTLYVIICSGSFLRGAVFMPTLCGYHNLCGYKIMPRCIKIRKLSQGPPTQDEVRPLCDGSVGLGHERGHVPKRDLDLRDVERPEAVGILDLD